MFVFGLILGISLSIAFYKYQNDIMRVVNVKYIKKLFEPKPTVTSYGFNTKTNVLTLEYSNKTKKEFYKEKYIGWRYLPDMRNCPWEVRDVLDAYVKKIEFESNTL